MYITDILVLIIETLLWITKKLNEKHFFWLELISNNNKKQLYY